MTRTRQFSVDGRQFEYAYESHETGGFDRAVVCVHGITRNRHDFSFLAERLRVALNVYAPDLLGHGDNAWLEPGMVYEKEMFLAQLGDLM
ncbi:MAG: alpha/beta fold hydrolase, partial [Gammaproteobacteria bacterium]